MPSGAASSTISPSACIRRSAGYSEPYENARKAPKTGQPLTQFVAASETRAGDPGWPIPALSHLLIFRYDDTTSLTCK